MIVFESVIRWTGDVARSAICERRAINAMTYLDEVMPLAVGPAARGLPSKTA